MNNRPLIVLYGPVNTYSGYGARSRDIAKAILKLNKYNLKIISCNWGVTPHGFLNPNVLEHKQILDCLLPNNQINEQPDLWIMVTIPSEMQTLGKQNWIITAGFETTITSPQQIEGCNKADLVLFSSQHSKDSILNSKFEKRDQNSNNLVEVIECKKDIQVLFEGYDDKIYKKQETSSFDLGEIKEEFLYLVAGHWLPGLLGEDRKDIGMTIKVFLETFRNKKIKPALILKVNSGTFSIMDRDSILEKIQKLKGEVEGDLPNVYLLHGSLTDEQMNELYNHPKIKAMVSFTKGEGFGRPLLEFSITQKPIIASNWSGQIDFLNKDFCILLSGNLTNVHESAANDMLMKEAQWFTVDYKNASKVLEDVYLHYNKYLEGAKRQAYRSRTEFNLDKMKDKLEEHLSKVPFIEVKKFVLPTLKRVQNPITV